MEEKKYRISYFFAIWTDATEMPNVTAPIYKIRKRYTNHMFENTAKITKNPLASVSIATVGFLHIP